MAAQASLSEPTSYAVELKTAAYLKDWQDQAEIPLTPSTSPSLWMVLTQTLRAWKVVWSVVVLLAVGINVLALNDKEANFSRGKARRTSGVDWLLWASGSNKTFESILGDKLEKARIESEFQWAQSQPANQPFEIKPFDANSLQWNPVLNGNSPIRRGK